MFTWAGFSFECSAGVFSVFRFWCSPCRERPGLTLASFPSPGQPPHYDETRTGSANCRSAQEENARPLAEHQILERPTGTSLTKRPTNGPWGSLGRWGQWLPPHLFSRLSSLANFFTSAESYCLGGYHVPVDPLDIARACDV